VRFLPQAVRGAAAAVAMAVAALAAGCAGGTPATGTPATRSATTGSAATGSASAHRVAAKVDAGTSGAVPPVFAASIAPARAGSAGDRVALLSSRTGERLRWLAPPPERATDEVLGLRDGWVYFVRYPIDVRSAPDAPSPAIWRVRVTGGRAQLVQAGATGYAVSPDGRAVASVISADHGDVIELVARNLVTGRRHTIILATRPDPEANNWPPDVLNLTWAPDDVHLAVQFQLTAAINGVLVFDAFTAATARDGRTAPAPCPVSSACGEFDPAYLASGALTYVIQRLSGSGAARASLVAWQAGHRTTLLSFPAGMQAQFYDMTAQGQAIWVSGPAGPKGPWRIWRWSGGAPGAPGAPSTPGAPGAPVQITALPPLGASAYYGVGAIAW
jgi:hypothetical protein